MSARPSRIGAHELGDVGAVVLVVGVGVDDHVGAELQRRVDARPGSRPRGPCCWSGARGGRRRARARPRSSRRSSRRRSPATRPRRSPSTSRGRSASVCGSCSASLKQGIWMMSFIAVDCLDLAPGSIPKRRSRSWRQARRAHPPGAGRRPRDTAKARWKARRSPGRARARPGWRGCAPCPPSTLGARRLRGAVRRRAGRLLRLPHLPDLRLLLRAAVGARPAAPAPAGLPASTAARPSTRWRSPSGCSARSSAQGGARLMVLGSIALVRGRSSPASTGSDGCASGRSSALSRRCCC